MTNDLDSELKIYWIDWNKKAKLYATIKRGESVTEDSLANLVWVLANKATNTCVIFETGVTKGFEETDSTVKVSDISANKCDLSAFEM